MKMIHMTCPGHPEATLEGYILDCEILYGQEKKRPAILVCPGGGYLYCSPPGGGACGIALYSQRLPRIYSAL